jgi:deaminated glutathione amidase
MNNASTSSSDGATPDTCFRAALIQTCTGRDVDRNLEQTAILIEQAARAGAEYIQTPEVTTLITADRAELFSKTAPEEGNPAVAFFAKLSERLGVWLHIGSMGIQVEAGDRLANRTFLFAPNGQCAAHYDKIHMFDVDIGKGDQYWESQRYRGGEKSVVATLPWGRLGLTICYDMRFPALYRALAHAGAHFIAVPSAFTVPTGKAHWHTLLRARAIETQCFVFAAAQAGEHESGRKTYGHSLIVSPWGEILADAGDLKNSFVTADIRLNDLFEARRRVPSLTHDRPFEIIHAPNLSEVGRSGQTKRKTT